MSHVRSAFVNRPPGFCWQKPNPATDSIINSLIHAKVLKLPLPILLILYAVWLFIHCGVDSQFTSTIFAFLVRELTSLPNRNMNSKCLAVRQSDFVHNLLQVRQSRDQSLKVYISFRCLPYPNPMFPLGPESLSVISNLLPRFACYVVCTIVNPGQPLLAGTLNCYFSAQLYSGVCLYISRFLSICGLFR